MCAGIYTSLWECGESVRCVQVYIYTSLWECGESVRCVQVDLVNDPRSVLELALSSREFSAVASRLDANSFVLKVVGKEEYFLKEVPIIQYKV